jgi:hypothetical protein
MSGYRLLRGAVDVAFAFFFGKKKCKEARLVVLFSALIRL